MHRSQAGQVEYWARIGRAIEHSGHFDYNRIARVLQGGLSVDELSAYEKPVFDAIHDDMMQSSSAAEEQAHKYRLNTLREAGIDPSDLGD